MSNRRRHEPGPKKINREPARCVCQPGPDAHYQHSKPGRVAAKHFDEKCPHWDRSSVVVVVRSTARRFGKKAQAAIERLQLEPFTDVALRT